MSKTVSLSDFGFTSTPKVIVCPYCSAAAGSGYAVGAYVRSVSTTQFVAQISSNYTSALTMALMWIAFGV